MPSLHSDRGNSPQLSPGEIVVGGLAWLNIVITTWAFAGRAAWAPPTFTALAMATALASLVMARRSGRPVRWGPFVPLLGFAALIAISLLNPSHDPVPGHPGRWTEHPGWFRWLPTTVDRTTTLQQMLPWVSALLIGGALRQTLQSRRAAKLFWAALVGHLATVAIAGIYFHVTTPYETLGLIRDRHGYHFASFVYRNHWAAAVILVVPIALGFSFSALRRWTRSRGPFDAVFGGFGIALLLAITLPIPGTRSGIIVTSAILAFALLKFAITIHCALRATRAYSKWIPLMALALFAALVAVGGLFLAQNSIGESWQRTKQQLQGLTSGESDLRMLLTRDTLRMARDRPVWGWGLGSFGITFHLYQGDYLRDPNGRINALVVHAHNDWAQIAAETGAVGLLLALALVSVLIRQGWNSGDVRERWVTGGITALLLYALVDFPLHNPAVLLMTASALASLGGKTDELQKTPSQKA